MAPRRTPRAGLIPGGRAARPLPRVTEPSPAGIPIHESGDPLVTVVRQAGIQVRPAYHERGISTAPAAEYGPVVPWVPPVERAGW